MDSSEFHEMFTGGVLYFSIRRCVSNHVSSTFRDENIAVEDSFELMDLALDG